MAAAIEGVSGAAGGVLALLATYPLLTASLLQATRSRGEGQAKSNTLQELRDVVRQHGWQGLWAGAEASIVGTAASQGVYFYFYSVLRQAFVARHERLTGKAAGPGVDLGVLPSLTVSTLAGCLNVLLTCPIWVCSTRMQAQAKAKERSGLLESAREIYEESGLKGFWRGVLPSLIMVINPSLNYFFYEWLLSRYHRLGGVGQRRPGAAAVFALSSLAKLGATLLSYPVLLVKSRLQAAGRGTAADRRYRGTLDAIFKIWRTEGPGGFFKGMRAKIVQSILAAALLMVAKEELAALVGRVVLQAAILKQGALPAAAKRA